MKKMFAFAMALTMLGACTACAGGNSSEGGDSTPSQTETEATGTTALEISGQNPPDIGNKATIGIYPDIHVKEGDTKAIVPVNFWNNPGFAGIGLRLEVDEKLSFEVGKNNVFQQTPGAMMKNMLIVCLGAPEKHSIAFTSMGQQAASLSGNMFTFELTLPKDAKSGDHFPIKLTLIDLADLEKKAVPADTLDGEIIVD